MDGRHEAGRFGNGGRENRRRWEENETGESMEFFGTYGEPWGGEEFSPVRRKQLDCPLFSGMDPDGWLFRMNQYFSINRFSEKEKLMAAGVALEGDALSWFQWQNQRRPFITWTDFKVALLQRFRSSQEGNLCERFLAIRQTGTVAEYRRNFEVSAAPLQEVPEEILEGIFINGLRADIRAELRLLKPE